MHVGELQQNEVHVWSLTLQRTAQEVAELAALLSLEEHDRAARYRVDSARNAFIVVRALLRRLLGAYGAGDPHGLRLAFGTAGKPCLCDPRGLHFNVSHSADLGLIALSRSGPVGVDVERIRPLNSRDLLIGVLSEQERQVLASLPEDARDAAFFRAWTCKEAFVKADGAGIAYGLERVEVTLSPIEPARLLRLKGSAEAACAWSLWSFEPAPGYQGALVAAGQDCRVVMRTEALTTET
jgi:4'-phosphopantetheinyl transferase